MNKTFLGWLPWLLSIAAILVSLAGWSGTEELFPFFGLLAFGLMWIHYAVDFLQRFVPIEPRGGYHIVTRYIVFFALLMHPGLLAIQQFQNGAGVPPASLLRAVDPSVVAWVVVGIVAWCSFMAFELDRWYRQKSWFKYLGFVADAAMFGIIFHALHLGGDVQTGWFHTVWIFYAVTLVAFLIKAYYDSYQARNKN